MFRRPAEKEKDAAARSHSLRVPPGCGAYGHGARLQAQRRKRVTTQRPVSITGLDQEFATATSTTVGPVIASHRADPACMPGQSLFLPARQPRGGQRLLRDGDDANSPLRLMPAGNGRVPETRGTTA